MKRNQFFALTGLDPERHTTFKKRNLLPIPPSRGRDYTAFEAYAFLLSDKLASAPDGPDVARKTAATIIADCLCLIAARGSEIAKSSARYRRDPKAQPILVGRLLTRDGHKHFCGTRAELAAAELDIVSLVLTSATATYAVLRERAARHRLDLAGMWPTLPPDLRSQPGVSAYAVCAQ